MKDNHKSRRPHSLRYPETPAAVVEKIRIIRETYPRWGKEKIYILLKKELLKERKECLLVSVSTVGRTINRLKQRGVLKEPITNYIPSKKRFLKKAWATRKPNDYQVEKPGDLVQIDTLDTRPVPDTIRKNNSPPGILLQLGYN